LFPSIRDLLIAWIDTPPTGPASCPKRKPVELNGARTTNVLLASNMAAGIPAPRSRSLKSQTLRGVEKYRNRRQTKGVKMIEQKKKPQKPMRRFEPKAPANMLSAK
jgi:hypothetical protein